MAKGKAPIERRLRDEAKLARWDEQTYYALVESAEKSHRKLSQLVGEYERSVLHQTVGPVIDAVDSLGIRNNTYIIFASDNGAQGEHWTNNKGGPHNVVFDEEAIPSGVDQASISMDDQLGDEGATFTKKFDVAGTYSYYCEPHRGAGMNAQLIVG